MMAKRIALAFCLLAALALVAAAQAPRATTHASMAGATNVAQEKSLYTRLGGYDAIALVVDDFITRLATDKRFERFFAGFSTDSKKRLRQHILDQFCRRGRAVRLHGPRHEDHPYRAGNPVTS